MFTAETQPIMIKKKLDKNNGFRYKGNRTKSVAPFKVYGTMISWGKIGGWKVGPKLTKRQKFNLMNFLRDY